MCSTEQEFQKSVKKVNEMKSSNYHPGNDALLFLYARFKQASIGDNHTQKPGIFEMKERKKWEAWTEVKGMTKDQAMHDYIGYVKQM